MPLKKSCIDCSADSQTVPLFLKPLAIYDKSRFTLLPKDGELICLHCFAAELAHYTAKEVLPDEN